MSTPARGHAPSELHDLLEALARHRGFLTQTLAGMTDEQAGERSTVSALCLGGLIKHVAATERTWIEFAVHGEQPSDDAIDWGAIDWSNPSPEALAALGEREAEFSMLPEDTVESVLAGYATVAEETERTLRGLDLDASHELPKAPWFEPGARWTVRRTVIHVIAETSQHAGHADIIREAIDGAKTMG
ncbi:DinB family protein [Pseudactinotalea sp.]|uniref:DinB family protein n=1 Tax=Pseudactinotalea sp. TaxID=1926260 RepID=UPI003B3A8B18